MAVGPQAVAAPGSASPHAEQPAEILRRAREALSAMRQKLPPDGSDLTSPRIFLSLLLMNGVTVQIHGKLLTSIAALASDLETTAARLLASDHNLMLLVQRAGNAALEFKKNLDTWIAIIKSGIEAAQKRQLKTTSAAYLLADTFLEPAHHDLTALTMKMEDLANALGNNPEYHFIPEAIAALQKGTPNYANFRDVPVVPENNSVGYADHNDQTIHIDPHLLEPNKPYGLYEITHELFHIRGDQPIDYHHGADACVNSFLVDEGRADATTGLADEEYGHNQHTGDRPFISPQFVTDTTAKFFPAGSPTPPNPTDPRLDRAAKEIAREYQNLHPSTAPTKTYPENDRDACLDNPEVRKYERIITDSQPSQVPGVPGMPQ